MPATMRTTNGCCLQRISLPTRVPFVGDMLKLTTLNMQIAVGGDNSFDTSASEPVTATGTLAWEHEFIGRLGIANNSLPFTLSYHYTNNGQSGFQLAIAATPAAPIDVPRVFTQIESGRLRVDVLPDEQALVLSLIGDAKLALGGGMLTQAQQFLAQVLCGHRRQFHGPAAFHLQAEIPTGRHRPAWWQRWNCRRLLSFPIGAAAMRPMPIRWTLWIFPRGPRVSAFSCPI